MIKVCRVCGKKFNGHWASSVCSEECKKERRKEINKEYQERQKETHYNSRKKKKTGLADLNNEARGQGVSYGYYMAMREGRI